MCVDEQDEVLWFDRSLKAAYFLKSAGYKKVSHVQVRTFTYLRLIPMTPRHTALDKLAQKWMHACTIDSGYEINIRVYLY